MRGGSIASNAVTSSVKPTDYANILGGAKKSTKKTTKTHRGGSQASDAVVKAVSTGAFEKMNTMFTNLLGGSIFKNFKVFNQQAGTKAKKTNPLTRSARPQHKPKPILKKSKKIQKGGQCTDATTPAPITKPIPTGTLPDSPHSTVDLSGAQPGVVSSLSQPLSTFEIMESRTLYPSYYSSYAPVLVNGGKKKSLIKKTKKH